jgi:antitoxin (DNA-binding transcriptional repressor) of toxin-antitoxin stability system
MFSLVSIQNILIGRAPYVSTVLSAPGWRQAATGVRSIPVPGTLTLPRFLGQTFDYDRASAGEVKSHLSEIVDRIHDHHERATVTVHGRPSGVNAAARAMPPFSQGSRVSVRPFPVTLTRRRIGKEATMPYASYP